MRLILNQQSLILNQQSFPDTPTSRDKLSGVNNQQDSLVRIHFFVNLQLLPLWSERGGEEVNNIKFKVKYLRLESLEG